MSRYPDSFRPSASGLFPNAAQRHAERDANDALARAIRVNRAVAEIMDEARAKLALVDIEGVPFMGDGMGWEDVFAALADSTPLPASVKQQHKVLAAAMEGVVL